MTLPRDVTRGLTYERLKEILHYEPASGIFTWKKAIAKSLVIGSAAGTINGGYRCIIIGYDRYRAHRLAWFYVYGVWPNKYLDHINGARDDNRIENLREATTQQNSRSVKVRKSSKTGYTGVVIRKDRPDYYSQIWVNNQRVSLGVFESFTQAVLVAKLARIAYFGRFRGPDHTD